MTAAAAPAAAPDRVGRSYTRARRLPGVLGKIGDVTLWLGPYNAAQLIVAAGGAFVLIKTFSWWSVLGPLPVIGWVAAIWVLRGSTIAGRQPLYAVLGWLMFAVQPATGRLAGRAAKVARPHVVGVGCLIQETAPPTPGALPVRSAVTTLSRPALRPAMARPAPTALQQLLTARQGVGA
ncbi:hypothetical protein [Streptomyces violascens]|uniref:hypothetical protein n=1 Tax=Streptomyces violascens TaxID=67381 RepID=UPI003679A985